MRLEVSGHGCSESVLPRYNLIYGRGWGGSPRPDVDLLIMLLGFAYLWCFSFVVNNLFVHQLFFVAAYSFVLLAILVYIR